MNINNRLNKTVHISDVLKMMMENKLIVDDNKNGAEPPQLEIEKTLKIVGGKLNESNK